LIRLPQLRLRGFHGEERAQALVEFALVMPIFLLLVTGIFDVGRAVWQENTLAYAAREGTRYAIVHGASGNPVVGPCSGCLNPVTNNLDGGNNRNQRVTVDATAAFIPMPSQYLLGGAFTLTLRGGSQLVIQR
jgi:hypothetical protein